MKARCVIVHGLKATCTKLTTLSGGRIAYVYLPDTGFGRLHVLQPLLLCPGWTRRRGYLTSASTAAVRQRITSSTTCGVLCKLLDDPRRSGTLPLPSEPLRSQGDDHQHVRWFGADALPWYFRDAKLGRSVAHAPGRAGGNLSTTRTSMDGRRCDGSARGFLQSERAIGKWRTTALHRTMKLNKHQRLDEPDMNPQLEKKRSRW